MSKLRVASLVLLVVASTGLLFGSMGFSSVAADRGVSVAVADDDSALVGYHTEDLAVADGERVTLVTVANRLSSSASVTNVTVATDDPAVQVRNVSEPSVDTGETSDVRADVHCRGRASATVTVSVTVEADGVTAAISGDTATRSFEVNCSAAGENAGGAGANDGDARFDGAGNFDFGATDGETVNVTYWTASKQGGDWSFTEYGPENGVDTAAKFKTEVGEGPKYVAVYVHEWNETYVHPGLDRANGTVDWGAGDAVVEDGRFDPTAD